jgi:hypothetical protein
MGACLVRKGHKTVVTHKLNFAQQAVPWGTEARTPARSCGTCSRCRVGATCSLLNLTREPRTAPQSPNEITSYAAPHKFAQTHYPGYDFVVLWSTATPEELKQIKEVTNMPAGVATRAAEAPAERPQRCGHCARCDAGASCFYPDRPPPSRAAPEGEPDTATSGDHGPDLGAWFDFVDGSEHGSAPRAELGPEPEPDPERAAPARVDMPVGMPDGGGVRAQPAAQGTPDAPAEGPRRCGQCSRCVVGASCFYPDRPPPVEPAAEGADSGPGDDRMRGEDRSPYLWPGLGSPEAEAAEGAAAATHDGEDRSPYLWPRGDDAWLAEPLRD